MCIMQLHKVPLFRFVPLHWSMWYQIDIGSNIRFKRYQLNPVRKSNFILFLSWANFASVETGRRREQEKLNFYDSVILSWTMFLFIHLIEMNRYYSSILFILPLWFINIDCRNECSKLYALCSMYIT